MVESFAFTPAERGMFAGALRARRQIYDGGSWRCGVARRECSHTRRRYYGLRISRIPILVKQSKLSAAFGFPVRLECGRRRSAARQWEITLFEGAPGICALSGVSGPLKYNAWDDGAMITWPAKSPGNWTIQVKNGKTGFVTCLD